MEETIAAYDERIAFIELGVYEPHFDFNDSEAFKFKIKEAREQQKDLIKNKRAAYCPIEWTVDDNRSKGRTMINQQVRLTMRAFNNECEAAIANTRWNNVNAMEKRIIKSAESINKTNTSTQLEITEEYINLKLQELFLTYEYREQIKQEKEQRAEKSRSEREEKSYLLN